MASAGVAGATTFRPGTCAYHTSRFCECVAASCWPPPPGVRMTSGTLTWPPNMAWIFAAWFTIWSIASRLKLMVMISTTGRRPSIAAPIAAPTKPSSAIGVSRTRFGPELVQQPGRDLVGALEDTDLLAEQDDRLVPVQLGAQRVVQRLPVGDQSHEITTRFSGQRCGAFATVVA